MVLAALLMTLLEISTTILPLWLLLSIIDPDRHHLPLLYSVRPNASSYLKTLTLLTRSSVNEISPQPPLSNPPLQACLH